MGKMIRVQMNAPDRETAKAYGFSIGENTSYKNSKGGYTQVNCLTWFAKSICSLDNEWLTLPVWLAKKTGLYIALKHGMAELL